MSALLDHEDPGVDAVEIDGHVATCAACASYRTRLDQTHRAVRLRRAEPVPDLTPAILARLAPPPNPHDAVLGWLRSGLTFIGVLVVALSAALLLSGSAVNPAHLAAWDLAFGGALLFAAWQPDRARGLLPMAWLLVVSMTTASVIEIGRGHPATHGIVFHAAELIGVILLTLLVRHRQEGRSRATLSAT